MPTQVQILASDPKKITNLGQTFCISQGLSWGCRAHAGLWKSDHIGISIQHCMHCFVRCLKMQPTNYPQGIENHVLRGFSRATSMRLLNLQLLRGYIYSIVIGTTDGTRHILLLGKKKISQAQ